MIRRLMFGAGVAAALLGLALIAAPGLTGGVSISRILVYGLGALALLLAVGAMLRRRSTEFSHAETGVPEEPTSLPRPGSDVDTRLRNLFRLQSQSRLANERQNLDDRLEELAIRIVARREECPRSTARELIERGDWTDNRFAAAYFAEDVTLPLGARVRASFRGSVTGECARHAIEELAGRTPGGEDDR